MRLICPNCAAQYEVDVSMIPDEGRDVQCSSCGHTWFQQSETAKGTLTNDHELAEPDPDFEPPAPAEPPKPAAKARPMDDLTREILRQEAEHEAAARRREMGESLEIQPDLGLSDPNGAESRAAAAKARLARLRDTPEEATEKDAAQAAIAATVAPNSRRELLPDIEEINSTLTATGERDTADHIDDEIEQVKTRRGFRLGFFLVFGVFAVMAALYLFAPQLANKAPGLTPTLNAYLDWANGLRDGINGLLQTAVDAMGGNA
ncbi:zinc-ribbon domain-containing protein [Oceaniglobus ichthyenteri]|uniref:zinc-ribbon domain-containing protein n=1 Tax=Oceaniglobus ichthyenteri TaxID=2136177 RepID=UPI0013DDFA8B|nr:zinc-ribbon domain-containing protein [Oceaniglobus ichthyenteri]